MKTIDVKTTQNVVISYELASFRERFFAWFLDSLLKSILVSIFFFLAFVVFDWHNEQLLTLYMVFTVFPVVTFYSLILEYFMHGQTPGKAALGIRAMKMNGQRMSFYDYLIRWVFRMIDIYLSAGILGSIVLLSNPRNQRLGDMLSNTIVVKLAKKANSISLNQLLQLDNRINYQPQYLGIKNFREEDILVIKQTLDRFGRFENQGHKEAVRLLAQKMAEKLDVPISEADKPQQFLKTLIKDYVVLTR